MMRRRRSKRSDRGSRVILMLLLCVCALGAALVAGQRSLARQEEQDAAPGAFEESGLLFSSPGTADEADGPPLIVLDAGHGGKDPGSSSRGVDEKDINLEIVFKAARLLEEEGYAVALTREDDSFVSLEDRVAFASEQGAAAFVSVHLNALDDDTVTHGVETYSNESACAGSAALARAVQSRVVAETGGKDRGVTTDSEFYVVHHAQVPACLLEAGFLTAEEEGALLMDSGYQDKVAAGIAAGVMEYLQGI